MKLLIPIVVALLSLSNSVYSQETLTPKEGFSVNDNEEHFYLFVLNNRPSDLPELRAAITKYIWKQYPNSHLKITQIEIDGSLAGVPLLHVQSFNNKAEALAFHKALKINHPDFLYMGMTEDYFPISKTNFETVVRNKSLEGYKEFFQKNYH